MKRPYVNPFEYEPRVPIEKMGEAELIEHFYRILGFKIGDTTKDAKSEADVNLEFFRAEVKKMITAIRAEFERIGKTPGPNFIATAEGYLYDIAFHKFAYYD